MVLKPSLLQYRNGTYRYGYWLRGNVLFAQAERVGALLKRREKIRLPSADF